MKMISTNLTSFARNRNGLNISLAKKEKIKRAKGKEYTEDNATSWKSSSKK